MILKQILRNDVKTILLDHIAKGKISPNQRISLPAIAEDLGVSATPVREALSQLVEAGIVTYIPNRGFFVSELRKEEAIELYELMLVLESTALKHSQTTKAQLIDLKKIHVKFSKATNAAERLKLDMVFHQCLISSYKNEYGLKLIEDIRLRIFIYEYTYMTNIPDSTSYDIHTQIIDYLEHNKIIEAAEALQSNWANGITHLLE